MKALYDNAVFHLGEDYTIEACHNDMKHDTTGEDKKRAGIFGVNHRACKSLKVEDAQTLTFKGQQNPFVSIDVKEIQTIHSGVCIGKFVLLDGVPISLE